MEVKAILLLLKSLRGLHVGTSVSNAYKYAVIIIVHVIETLGRPGSPPFPLIITNVEHPPSQPFICRDIDPHLMGVVTKCHSHFTGSGQPFPKHFYRRVVFRQCGIFDIRKWHKWRDTSHHRLFVRAEY